MAKAKNDSPADFMPPPARNSFEFGAAADNGGHVPIVPDAIPPAKEDAKPRPRMDAELQAMAKIDRILADLPPKAQARVVRWLADRHTPEGE